MFIAAQLCNCMILLSQIILSALIMHLSHLSHLSIKHQELTNPVPQCEIVPTKNHAHFARAAPNDHQNIWEICCGSAGFDILEP